MNDGARKTPLVLSPLDPASAAGEPGEKWALVARSQLQPEERAEHVHAVRQSLKQLESYHLLMKSDYRFPTIEDRKRIDGKVERALALLAAELDWLETLYDLKI
jgi:hypothetical protein